MSLFSAVWPLKDLGDVVKKGNGTPAALVLAIGLPVSAAGAAGIIAADALKAPTKTARMLVGAALGAAIAGTATTGLTGNRMPALSLLALVLGGAHGSFGAASLHPLPLADGADAAREKRRAERASTTTTTTRKTDEAGTAAATPPSGSQQVQQHHQTGDAAAALAGVVGPLPQVQAAVASAALGNSGGSLQGRVILITGAGGGLGRAAAVLFAQRGAKVVAADVDAAAATETAAQVGGEAHGVAVDVANEESVQAMVASAVAKFGRIDGALNAAGIEGGRARLHETSSANYDRVLGVNLRGTFLCMKAEIDQMLKQPPPVPRGAVIAAASDASAPAALSAASAPAAIDTRNYSIVNVSSTAGQAAMPEFSCYSASKFALIGFTRSAAKEYAKDGIRVHAVCPSTTATPMVERFQSAWPEWQARQNASFPVGRIGRAEEVAAACAFLLSWDCPMVTGTTLTIDGGAGA